MAKTLKVNGSDDDGVAQAGHNAEARAGIIQDVVRQLASLEAERKAVGEQIREIKQKRIKGDLGMKLADFNAVMRLYSLEDERRSEFFDTLREGFRALGVGDQLNFMDAMPAGGSAGATA